MGSREVNFAPMALLDWMTDATGPLVRGHGVLLRPPRASDYAAWAELRASANFSANTFVGNATAVTATPKGENLPDAVIGLKGNRFSKNGDAVYITVAAAIGSNVVVRNRGYGIYAPSATDLGGNIAVGNGISPQCVGVVCRPS